MIVPRFIFFTKNSVIGSNEVTKMFRSNTTFSQRTLKSVRDTSLNTHQECWVSVAWFGLSDAQRHISTRKQLIDNAKTAEPQKQASRHHHRCNSVSRTCETILVKGLFMFHANVVQHRHLLCEQSWVQFQLYYNFSLTAASLRSVSVDTWHV